MLAVASEDFERVNVDWDAQRGLVRCAGFGKPSDVAAIGLALWDLLVDESARRAMFAQGPEVVDGRGSGMRVDLLGRCSRGANGSGVAV